MSKWDSRGEIGWFWIAMVALVAIFTTSSMVERRQKNYLIQSCINQNKSVVIENNELKECK